MCISTMGVGAILKRPDYQAEEWQWQCLDGGLHGTPMWPKHGKSCLLQYSLNNATVPYRIRGSEEALHTYTMVVCNWTAAGPVRVLIRRGVGGGFL